MGDWVGIEIEDFNCALQPLGALQAAEGSFFWQAYRRPGSTIGARSGAKCGRRPAYDVTILNLEDGRVEQGVDGVGHLGSRPAVPSATEDPNQLGEDEGRDVQTFVFAF
jgi:hypothetical protein